MNAINPAADNVAKAAWSGEIDVRAPSMERPKPAIAVPAEMKGLASVLAPAATNLSDDPAAFVVASMERNATDAMPPVAVAAAPKLLALAAATSRPRTKLDASATSLTAKDAIVAMLETLDLHKNSSD
jgi:hypothetical protein